MANRDVRLSTATLAMLFMVSGCGKAIGSGSSADSTPSDRAKLNAYTEGYNVVLGGFGLKTQLENYDRGHIMGPAPEPEAVILNNGWLDQARVQLKAGRAMPTGDLGEADAAVDRFLPALDKLMAHETALNSYYTSKAWRDDGLARGKREDPVLRAELTTAIAEGDRLEAVLTKARDAGEAAELDRLKSSGDTLAYDTKLALHQARLLAAIFHNDADLKDPKKIAAADAQVVILQKTLADQHAEVAKAKAKRAPSTSDSIGIADFRVDTLGRAADALDAMLGHYRDLKAGGGTYAYQAMIGSYNEAIGDANSGTVTH